MNKYWRYYLLLEKKFIDTLNYVELDEKNFSTYSVEYAHQLLAIGSNWTLSSKFIVNSISVNEKTSWITHVTL